MENLQLTYKEKSTIKNKLPIVIFLDNLNDPRNTGMIFRLADAFGVSELILSENTPAPPSVKLKRTARGTDKIVRYKKVDDKIAAITSLKNNGYTLLSLEITQRSKDIKAFNFKQLDKICIIAGSEEHGISKELLEISDETIHIEMIGTGLSMNVANALAIMLYETSKHFLK